MVQLLVDCVWDPNARDIAFESYAPHFLQIVLPETNRLTSINLPGKPIHEPTRNIFSCPVRVISWIVLAGWKNNTKPI